MNFASGNKYVILTSCGVGLASAFFSFSDTFTLTKKK